MGVITRVLSAISNRIKADRGASDINEMEHLQPLGDDSKPLPQDDGWSDRTNQSGGDVYFGAFDYENKIAEPGEKRIYARNGNGEVVGEVYLQKDGTITTKNASGTHTVKPDGSIESVNGGGYIKLLASGAVDINGFMIQPTGAASSPVSFEAPTVVAATSMTVAGKEMADHTHSGVQSGPDNTGPNN